MTRRVAPRPSHLDEHGAARMVDVSEKPVTLRRAEAEAAVVFSARTGKLVKEGRLAKGDLAAVVRLAAIQGAKRAHDIIPLCHPLGLDHVAVALSKGMKRWTIRVSCATTGRTGVEMEAMAGAAVGALALYDMIKGVDRGAAIESVRLLTKSGGRSGTYRR
jgi:cyclic pyranopterin phosphate synthase